MANSTDKIVSLIQRAGPRLLRLYFPNDDGPNAGLLINNLEADERLSHDFVFTVTALSDDPNIALTDVQGRMVCVTLQRDDGSTRHFNGYCWEFARVNIENSLSTYQMVLKPWLALFQLRRNHHLFHHQSIREQSKEIFLHSGLANHEFRIHEEDPSRTFSCQYNESDYNYLHRRWEEMGWYYWYEHTMQGHKLIISDSSPYAEAVDGNSGIAWHHAGGSNLEDKIEQWAPRRTLVSKQVALSSWDFKQPSTRFGNQSSALPQGEAPAMEIYQYQGLYGFSDTNHAAHMAEVRMEQADSDSIEFVGEGNCRRMQAGRHFALQRDKLGQLFLSEEQNSAKNYLITAVQHSVDNNFLNEQGGQSKYHNRFRCVPLKQHWRAKIGSNSHAVHIPGVDTAVVVGPSGDNIHTDGFARIKVQFHWDRTGGSNENSSCWVRVASQWAGGELGMMNLPRIGEEVMVHWLGGNPDRPIVNGSLFNARNMPPWKLPSQQALSGLRSRELAPGTGNSASGRSNHLILDDTHEKIQAQLKSDHACSQLSLGAIGRIDSNAGRRETRGEGWEIATNAWGVARAGSGMLLTTEARDDVAGSAKSMAETLQRLYSSHEQHQRLTDLAEQHGAQDELQNEVPAKLRKQNTQIQGTPTAEFPELAAPHLVLASPAGIASTTRKSTHIASDEHTALTTGKNLSLASGKNLFASVRNTFRLFVHKAGMKLIAAAGDIDIEALKHSVHILAKLNIEQSAERITLTAKEEIVLNGGGSYVKLNAGGIEQGSKGTWVAHATTHSMVGPKSIPVKVEINPVKEEGPHLISVLAQSAEGKVLKDAVVTFFDPEKNIQIAKEKIEASGITKEIKAAHNQVYNALVGFEGWSAKFEELVDAIEDIADFDPGVLDEDRNHEH